MRETAAPLTIIEPKKGWVPIDFKETLHFLLEVGNSDRKNTLIREP